MRGEERRGGEEERRKERRWMEDLSQLATPVTSTAPPRYVCRYAPQHPSAFRSTHWHLPSRMPNPIHLRYKGSGTFSNSLTFPFPFQLLVHAFFPFTLSPVSRSCHRAVPLFRSLLLRGHSLPPASCLLFLPLRVFSSQEEAKFSTDDLPERQATRVGARAAEKKAKEAAAMAALATLR